MLIETQKYREYFFEIHTDEDAASPRNDFDNLGTMACWHRRLNLGDIQWDDDQDLAMKQAMKQAVRGGGVVLPCYLYSHSGITMNTTGFSCPWDSGQVGYIYATREKILDWFGWSRMSEDRRKRAKAQLVSEVATYDDYLTGSVYGFVVKGEDEDKDGSCWGFYGKDDMIKEVYSYIDGLMERDRKRKQKHTKAMIANHVPLEARAPT